MCLGFLFSFCLFGFSWWGEWVVFVVFCCRLNFGFWLVGFCFQSAYVRMMTFKHSL